MHAYELYLVVMTYHIGDGDSGDVWCQPKEKCDEEARTIRKRIFGSNVSEKENSKQLTQTKNEAHTNYTEKPKFDRKRHRESLRECRRLKNYERNRKTAIKFYNEMTQESVLTNVGIISEMSLPFRNSTILFFVFLALVFIISNAFVILWEVLSQFFPRAQIFEFSMLLHLLGRLFEKWGLNPFLVQMYSPPCCANGTHDNFLYENKNSKSGRTSHCKSKHDKSK